MEEIFKWRGRSKGNGNAKEDFVANFFMLHRHNLFSKDIFRDISRRKKSERKLCVDERNELLFEHRSFSSYVILCINFSRKNGEDNARNCIPQVHN